MFSLVRSNPSDADTSLEITPGPASSSVSRLRDQKSASPQSSSDVMIVQLDPRPGMAEMPIVLEEGAHGDDEKKGQLIDV